MAQRNRKKKAKPGSSRERLALGGRAFALNTRTSLVFVGGVVLLHSMGLALLFDPIAGLVNNHPVIEQDWGLHFHHLKSMEAFWRQSHRIWGYSPFFMAGYPANTIQDLSIKLFEFLAIGFSTFALTPIQWLKILAFLTVAAVPWVMYIAARNLFEQDEVNNIAALSAAFLGTVYWWNSFPREMLFYGMIGFAPASYVGVLGVSLLYRMSRQSSWWSPAHVGFLLIALAIPALHIQSVLVFLPATVVVLVVKSNYSRRNLLLWIAAAGVFSLLTNFAWLAPAFQHRGDDASAAIVDQLGLFTSIDPSTFLKDYLAPHGYSSFRPLVLEKGFRIVLLLLGSLGTLRLLRSEYRDLGIMLAAALLTLFLVAYFGSLMPLLRSWQPLRFKVPYDLFLALAASYVVAQRITKGSSASPAYLVPFLSACGLVAFLLNLTSTESVGRFQIRTRMNPELTEIVNWIGTEAPAEGRVLFEESGDETGFVYDGTYLSSFIPHWTGRQLIGGPINLYNDRHHFAEFHSGKLFKRDIQTLTDDEIKNYLRLYNVGAVVAFHPASIQRFRSIPGLVTVDRQIGKIFLMKVNQPLTWFLQGDGRVRAAANRLELSDVKGDELILKYHWTAGLAGIPAVKMASAKKADDPIPFIKISNPAAAFTLQIGK